MSAWDGFISGVRFLIIVGLWWLSGDVLSVFLVYGVFVAMPLLLMRLLRVQGFLSGADYLTTFIGLDLLIGNQGQSGKVV